MIDIVFPKDNEKEFIELAKKLGYKALCFVYNKPQKLKFDSGLEIYSGVLAGKSKENANIVVMAGREDYANQCSLDNSRFDLLFGLENNNKSDFMRQRNSGLNQVLCKLAYKHDVMIGFSFKQLLDSSGIFRSRIMGRMMQNIRLCRKYKVKMVIASFASRPTEMRAYHDLMSLFICLGMHPMEAKDGFRNALLRIKENIKKQGPDYIAKGIRKL